MKKGFTLIELLVVVLIMGILAAVALPQYTKAVEKARAAEGLSMIKSLSTGFEEYVLANNSLPSSFDALSVLPGNLTESGGCFVSRNFKYCLQTGPRLQAWRLNDGSSWGFIWYSSMQDVGVSGKKLYCYVRRNSKADQQNICKSIGGKEKIQSPTDANFDWYVLD